MLLGKSDPRLIVSTLPTPVGAGEGASAGVVHRQAPPRAAEKIAGMSMAQLNAERLARERERDEMRRLESSAEDEKNRLESSAEWLDRPISKKKNKEKSGGGGGGRWWRRRCRCLRASSEDQNSKGLQGWCGQR